MFNVGDRVVVYGCVQGNPHPHLYCYAKKATVTFVNEAHTELHIEIDAWPGGGVVHPKQCRKLVKKERKRVWISRINEYHTYNKPIGGEFDEYVQVKSKK